MGKNKTSCFNILFHVLFNMRHCLTPRSAILYFRCPHVLAPGYTYEYYCYGAHSVATASKEGHCTRGRRVFAGEAAGVEDV